MKNTSSVFRVFISFVFIIAFFSYGIYSVFLRPQNKKSSTDYLNAFSHFSLEDEQKQPVASGFQAPENNESTAVAAQSGEALGKVLNKTIKNSSANLSGGGVHIKNSTDLNIDISEFLSAKLGYTIEKNSSPQVLILHTHATESYLSEDRDYYTASDNPRTTDNSRNVTQLGLIVAEKLNQSGIGAIHDATQHDYPSYNESYLRASKTIKAYLKKYPSIKVVIDIHRDAIQSGSEKTKLTAEIEGRRAAQVMLVMGSQSGNVKNFPNWKENLKLALRLQKTFENMYPTLARPLSLMSRSYNEPLTTGSMLIEIGTDANSFSEAVYSAELVANALISTLGG